MPATLSASLPPASTVWPLHILYADDMPELCELMRDRLALDGHKVDTAADGGEALARLTRTPDAYHLIIADHNMPRIDGLDLVWHIRKLPYAGQIIILTSELSPAIHERYRRFGVNLLLTKPIFPPTFCQKLRQLFPAPPPVDPLTRETEPGPARHHRAVRG